MLFYHVGQWKAFRWCFSKFRGVFLENCHLRLAELGMLWHGLSQRRLCRSPGRFSSRVKRAHRLWTRRHRQHRHYTCHMPGVVLGEECRNLPMRSTKPNLQNCNRNHRCKTPSPLLHFDTLCGFDAFCRRFLSLLVGCLSLAAMILVGNVGRHLCNFIPEATFQKAWQVLRLLRFYEGTCFIILLHAFKLH